MVTVYRLVLIPRRRDEERRHRLVQRFARLFRPENFVAFSRFEVHFQLRQRVYYVFYIFISSHRRRRREIKDALDALEKPFQRSFHHILRLFVERIHFLYLFFATSDFQKFPPYSYRYFLSLSLSRLFFQLLVSTFLPLMRALLLLLLLLFVRSFVSELFFSLTLYKKKWGLLKKRRRGERKQNTVKI